jgi:hypothetical protein
MQNTKHDQYFFAVLDNSLESLNNPSKYDVIDRLYDLNDKSKYPDPLLVELLDYGIGAGGSELLDQFITEKKEKILPLLRAKRAKPIECFSKYESICLNSNSFVFGNEGALALRNENIDELIDAIQKGIILWAVNPDEK